MSNQYVLVVDDDESMRYLTKHAIRESQISMEIHDAHDGQHACEVIEQHGIPAMIILDIRMPKMDGFEFLEHLVATKTDELNKVFVMTSSARHEDQNTAMGFRCVKGYYNKPLNADTFRAMVAHAA